jgi:hypothetical protein
MRAHEVLAKLNGVTAIHKAYTILQLHRPGDVLVSLPKNERSVVISEIRNVVLSGFGIPEERMSIAEIEEHVLQVDILAVVFDAEENICCFASARISQPGEFYLYGIAIHQRVQRSGLGYAVLKVLLESGSYETLMFTTQNPAMYVLARKFAHELYPSPVLLQVPAEFEKLARQCLVDRSGEYDHTQLTVKNLYAVCLYKQIKPLVDTKLTAWFWEKLRIDPQGQTRDGFICIGKIA